MFIQFRSHYRALTYFAHKMPLTCSLASVLVYRLEISLNWVLRQQINKYLSHTRWYLLCEKNWPLTKIRYDRQRSQAPHCNIHQGGDTLKSQFKLLRWCNPPRRHVALLCVFHCVVVSVFISLKARRLDQDLYYAMMFGIAPQSWLHQPSNLCVTCVGVLTVFYYFLYIGNVTEMLTTNYVLC